MKSFFRHFVADEYVPEPTMRLKLCLVTTALVLLNGPGAIAQDQDAAAQRDRLANQRIRAEAELRAQEEERDDSEVAAPDANDVVKPPMATDGEQASTSFRAAPASSATNLQSGESEAADLSLALDQLQRLGELRDAGYVTDAEFEQIKARILRQNL